MQIINNVAEEFVDQGKTSFATKAELCRTILWLRRGTAHDAALHARTALDAWGAKRLRETLDGHRRIAAASIALLHNGGAGPNYSQLQRVDGILRGIAGLPTEPNNQGASRGGSWWAGEEWKQPEGPR